MIALRAALGIQQALRTAARSLSWVDAFQLASLALFLATVAGHAIYLRVKDGINPVALRLRGKGALGTAEVALFAGVNLWAVALLERTLPFVACPVTLLCDRLLLAGALWRGLGIALILVALALLLAGQMALGHAWRLGIDERHPGPLVTDGVYRYSRNPLYLFFDLYFAGTFLLNGTAILLIFAVLTAGNLHYQALQEERFLLRVHGEAYRVYQQRTGRYVTLPRLLAAERVAPARE